MDEHQSNSSQGPQADSPRERQLELEINAFAELLFDFYEYKQKQKHVLTPPLDPGLRPLKMEERSKNKMLLS